MGKWRDTQTEVPLEGRDVQGYFVPAGQKSGNIPPGMQQSK